ncbi:MAG: lysophospholipid acyltransferase family protein [Capnocytophaga sp.]|nr:lysophospholipid acyltransferase family protein [Capnocytophaga sp.]
MNLLIYILAYPIIWLISVLPFRLLYIFSDFVYFWLYTVFKYRVKVVRKNLNLAFPEKSDTEKKRIERKFYSHMCDMFLEMAKSYGMNENDMRQRMVFTNIDIFEKYETQNRNISILCGHYASYEWMLSLGYFLKRKSYALYTPLSNPYFDRLVQKIRMKHKGLLLSRYVAASEMKRHRDEGILTTYGFAADQSPSSNRSYRRSFLGIRVPVFTGAERLGKQTNTVMIFANVQKVKRGYYETTFEVLSENPQSIPDFQITDMFFERLEQIIRAKPEYYLWTHNRFKRM